MATHTTNAALWKLYTNLLGGDAPLSENLQQRIYRFTQRTKNADLAAALARRVDTVDTIDRDLGGWPVAKVQSAWFARPGRSPEAIARHLATEKRVTVLEVAAGIEDLDADVYRALAARNAPRIAVALLHNRTAPVDAHRAAATTAAHAYPDLSWSRRISVRESLKEADPSVVSAFAVVQQDLLILCSFLNDIEGIDAATVDHLHALCRTALADVPARAEQFRQERAQHRWWRSPCAEIIEGVAGALAITSHNAPGDGALAEQVANDLVELRTLFTRPEHQDAGTLDAIDGALLHTGVTSHAVLRRIAQAKDAQSLDEIRHLLAQWTNDNESLDLRVADALLANAHMDAATTFTVMDNLPYRSRDRDRLSDGQRYRLDVFAAILAATHGKDDDYLEQHCGPHDPRDLWQAITLAMVTADRYGWEGLLGSRYAHSGIVPQLPFSTLLHRWAPTWLVSGVAEYLEANLDTDVAWDGFELLAKTHLGTFEQLVRAANAATRRNRCTPA